MTTIPVDEGYAYDYLAILQVKSNNNVGDIHSVYTRCYDHLRDEIGHNLHLIICNSQEYFDLVEANQRTFDCVERARYGSITAKEVDDSNMERYNMKVRLQNKYFPKSKVLEKKS
jgi:hypothetical protein